MATFSLNIQDIGITDDEVARILDELDAVKTEPQADRRSSVRSHLRGKAVLTVLQASLPPAPAFWVRLRNVSEHGVAFLKSGPMPIDAFVRLELPTGRDAKTTTKHTVIRHCRHVEGTIYEIGVEFLPDGTC